MVDVNVEPIEIEVTTRYGDLVRADVYLPKGVTGPFPVLLGASPYQKVLRHLPASPIFPFIEHGPIQFYLDEGYAYVAVDVPFTGRSNGTWDPVSRAEGEAIHDMIEHVATLDWAGPSSAGDQQLGVGDHRSADDPLVRPEGRHRHLSPRCRASLPPAAARAAA
jgi:hypothetical protein